jgi:hypothetical protein
VNSIKDPDGVQNSVHARISRARGIARSLQAAWILAALIFVVSNAFGGFFGWLSIFVWAAIAVPLAWITLGWFSHRGTPIERSCIVRARRSAALLGGSSLLFGFGMWLPDGTPLAVRYVVGIGLWIVFLGQIAFVTVTTTWMFRHSKHGDVPS